MKRLLVTAAFLALCGCATTDITPYSKSEMERKTNPYVFTASNGVVLPFRLYVSNYFAKSPLVVCLHGAGERGDDNTAQLGYGISHIARFVDDNIEDAVIVAPQCPCDRYWKSDDIIQALHELVVNFKTHGFVDASRVYVTGYSMGGEGTFVYALKFPEDVTTIVPICGGPLANTPYSYSDVDDRFIGKNVWAFNYFDDIVVDNTYSRTVVSKIWSMNTNNVHYTEGMEGGHTAEMYGSKKLLQWIFGTK